MKGASSQSISPRQLAALAALAPACCQAASSGGMTINVLMLPVALAFGVALHALISRFAKVVLSAAQPLASGELEACGYDRRVYHTAAPQMLAVVGVAMGAGLLMWLGYTIGWGWLGALGLLVALGAVGLDLWWWERVTASGSYLWFQRGWRGRVHQVAIENIKEITVDESEVKGFTLRHGRHNVVCRLYLRLKDDSVVALPKTDAHNGLADVEGVANHVRARQQQAEDRRALSDAEARATHTAREAATAKPSRDAAMLLELSRLRKKALAVDLPPAVSPATPAPVPPVAKE